MNLKVLGYSCSRTRRLEESCQELLKNLKQEGQVEVIGDQEINLKYDVKNTPALVIDDHLIFQGCAMSAKGIESMMAQHKVLGPIYTETSKQ